MFKDKMWTSQVYVHQDKMARTTWIDPQTPAPLLQNDYFTRDVA